MVRETVEEQEKKRTRSSDFEDENLGGEVDPSTAEKMNE